TAAMLGVTRKTVYARIAKHDLRPTGSAERIVRRMPAEVSDTQPEEPFLSPVRSVVAAELPAAPGSRSLSPATPDVTSAHLDAMGRPSIAVLPFDVHGESESQMYFGDGVVEHIIGALASLRDVFVISRTSTLRYRGSSGDVRTVGRELGVSYVLSGGVRRSGDSLSVSSELAETGHGTVVWASRFDG